MNAEVRELPADCRGFRTSRYGDDAAQCGDLHRPQAARTQAAVRAFGGGAPHECGTRHDEASPLRRLPLGVARYVVHGDRDSALPLAVTQHYVEAARSRWLDRTSP